MVEIKETNKKQSHGTNQITHKRISWYKSNKQKKTI